MGARENNYMHIHGVVMGQHPTPPYENEYILIICSPIKVYVIEFTNQLKMKKIRIH